MFSAQLLPPRRPEAKRQRVVHCAGVYLGPGGLGPVLTYRHTCSCCGLTCQPVHSRISHANQRTLTFSGARSCENMSSSPPSSYSDRKRAAVMGAPSATAMRPTTLSPWPPATSARAA